MLRCERCGYRAIFRPEPVAAAISREEDGRIWLLRRTLHEGAGRWTFPGGFVEFRKVIRGYGASREELEIDIELGELVGVYSRGSDRTVLVLFHASCAGHAARDGGGFRGARFAPGDLPWDEMAFWSTEQTPATRGRSRRSRRTARPASTAAPTRTRR
jgi:ADP-ribose pyrophosphatase YjhB (NUDIX family)